MSGSIHVHDDHGTRHFPADVPLQIGGAGADIRLDGVEGNALGVLGVADGLAFLGELGESVRVNGQVHDSACWLADGAVAVFDRAHLVCRVQGEDIVIQARSRRRDATPPPAADGAGRTVVEPVAYHPGRGAYRPVAATAPTLKFGLAAGFAVLGVVAWFLFTARSVDVVVDPEPETLVIEGAVWTPRVGGRYLLRPGRYEVTATRTGYVPLREALKVGNASSQQAAFELQKLPGRLSVSTGVLAGAEVLVDGELLGTTPIDGAEVPAGLHRFVVRARNHLPAEQELEIRGMGEPQALELDLVPNWAPVTLATEPPGARVLIDGMEAGTTPLTAQVEAGERVMKIELAGYKPAERGLTVIAGEPVELPPIELSEADGIMTLSTTPAGANVTVDGQFRGRTPLEIEITPGVSHEISLAKPGYSAATKRVRLGPGDRDRLAVTLAPILGSVRVVASPGDAELLVDGQPAGEANQVLSLTAAPHTIEVRKRGYASHVETVTPRRGLEQRLSVVLKTIAEAEAARLEAIITSVAGHSLRLIPTGSLQLGSPRREQGRRSNEVRRDVELTREFYVAETEVTNAQFREFMASHSSGFFGGLSLDGDNQPVVRLAWQQAARYCNWLSEREGLPSAYVERDGRLVARRPMTIGYRMPTEAEWAWIARYEAGPRPQKYPWGDNLPPPQGVANLADNAARSLVSQRIEGYDDGFTVTAPVASFAPGRLGLHDLGGNVSEWIHDYYEPGVVDPFRSFVDPMGPESGGQHVIRGPSWMHATITELRTAYRDHGAQGREDVGFRIARYAR